MNIYESNHKENDTVKEHAHATYQILYVLDGHGKCALHKNYSTIEKDYLMIIAPGTKHSIKANSKMTNLVLGFAGEDLDETVRHHLVPQAFVQSQVLKLSLFDCNDFRQLLRKMLYEKRYGDEIQEFIISAHLTEILSMIVRSTKERVSMFDKGSLAERLKEYIEKRYFEIESAEDMANKMNVSKRYIQAIFKDKYERTPMQYLTEIRIRVVKNLLVDTDKDIISICFEVGFESVSTFYRIFKNHVGMPPNAYRHNNEKITQ